MDKHNPVDAVNQLVEAVNQGNLDAAVACYEAGATLIVQPGHVATGTQAIRDAFAGFIAMKTIITTEHYKIIQSGDVVLYSSTWHATGTAPDGSAVKMAGSSSDVLRRQTDGRWLIVIDNPFGASILN
jgi:uncharacterized protein (TIGR02246 family)